MYYRASVNALKFINYHEYFELFILSYTNGIENNTCLPPNKIAPCEVYVVLRPMCSNPGSTHGTNSRPKYDKVLNAS